MTYGLGEYGLFTDENKREEVCGFVDRLRSTRKFCNPILGSATRLAQGGEGHDVEVLLLVGLVADVAGQEGGELLV